jgi:His-Xaa-Ser system protein HxsD
MNRSNLIKDGEVIAFADASIFSQEAILKCLYWYGDKFHTDISRLDEGTYTISLKPLATAGIKEEDLEMYLQKFERDLVDFSLRDTIGKETQNIRDLLVAKAFSHGEFDEEPQGEVSDPVGFNPNLNS